MSQATKVKIGAARILKFHFDTDIAADTEINPTSKQALVEYFVMQRV